MKALRKENRLQEQQVQNERRKRKDARGRLTSLVFASVIAAMMLFLAACGTDNANNAGNGNNGKAANDASTNAANANGQTTNADASADTNTGGGDSSAAQATTYPLTVKDVTGKELTFTAAPQHIVTLVPSETEIVYALGAGDEVVGVDAYSNYPEAAAAKEKVGDMNVDFEKIVSLKPDLVLASYTMSQAAVDKLRSLNIPVYATDPKTYDEVIAKITQIGTILDKAKQAAEVTAHMEQVRQEVAEKVKDAPKPKVYLEFSPGWTVGKGEFLDELITLAGGENIATKPSWYEIDPEAVLQTNPDDIIYASMTVKEGEKNPILAAIESRPGWKAMPALKNNRIYEVDQDPLTRVGPRLADGLLELARKLHPDLFK